MAIILITHDVGVIAENADGVVVMYGGKVMETADVKTVFREPKHPYTSGLLNAIPRLDIEQDRLYGIPGMVPDPLHFPPECRFSNRCEFKEEKCNIEMPNLVEVEPDHFSRCFFYKKSQRSAENC